MNALGIEGHEAIIERFRCTLSAGRLASSYLFVGPAGVGKRTFAVRLAQCLLCSRVDSVRLAPCDECDACRQVRAGTHPDLLSVARPKDKSHIPLELLIGPRQRRMREGLCHDIALRSFMGGWKVAVIDDADDLNAEGANALLKTLEEPPPRSLLILIGTAAEKQLPTIRSRCQVVRFGGLPVAAAADLLVRNGVVDDSQEALRLARLSGGRLARAAELADTDLREFRETLLARLAELPAVSVPLAAATLRFVEAAGKEVPKRRARAKLLIEFAADFYLRLLRELCGAGDPQVDNGGGDDPGTMDTAMDNAMDNAADDALRDAIAQARGAWAGREEDAASAAERCLDAMHQVDLNANLSTLIECWLNDLATLTARGFAETSAPNRR